MAEKKSVTKEVAEKVKSSPVVEKAVEKAEKAVKKVKTAAKKATQHKATAEKIELLVTVVGRNKAEYYTDLIQSFEVNLQVAVLSRGTANAKMMELLGLTDAEKTVIFSVIQEKKVQKAVEVLDEKFKTIKGGKGIAFTIPLTSVIGTLIYGFLSNNRNTVKEEK